MTYSYCTQRPYRLLREYGPDRRQARLLREGLTPRQLAAANLG